MARERRTSTTTTTTPTTRRTSSPQAKTSPIRMSTRSSSAKTPNTPNTASNIPPTKTITPKPKMNKTPSSVVAGKRKRNNLQTPSKSPSNTTKTQSSPTKRHSPRRAKRGAMAVSEALSSLSSSKKKSSSSSSSSPISLTATTNTTVAGKTSRQAIDESPTKAAISKKIETGFLQERTPYSPPPKAEDVLDDVVDEDDIDYKDDTVVNEDDVAVDEDSESEPEDHQYDDDDDDKNPFNSDEPAEQQHPSIVTDTKITPPKSSIFFKHSSFNSPSSPSPLMRQHSPPTVPKTVVVAVVPESPLRMETTTNESPKTPKTPLLQKVNSILKWLIPTEEERKEWAENGERILKIGKNVALTIKTTLMDSIATTVSPEEVEDYSCNDNGGVGIDMTDGATIITEYPSLSPVLDVDFDGVVDGDDVGVGVGNGVDGGDADISTMMIDTDAPLAAEPVNFGDMDIVDKHVNTTPKTLYNPSVLSKTPPLPPPLFSCKVSAPPQLGSSPKDLSKYFKEKKGMLSRDEYTKLQNIILAMGRSDGAVSNGAGGGSFLSNTAQATNNTVAINNLLPQHGRHPIIRKSRTFSARFDDDDDDNNNNNNGSAIRPSASLFRSNSSYGSKIKISGGDGCTLGDDRGSGKWSTIIKRELIDSQKRHLSSAKAATAAPVKSFVTSGVYNGAHNSNSNGNGNGGADSFSTTTANNTFKAAAAAAVTADSLKNSTFSITLPTPPPPPPQTLASQPTGLEENTSKGMFAFYGDGLGDNVTKTHPANTVRESKPFSFGSTTSTATISNNSSNNNSNSSNSNNNDSNNSIDSNTVQSKQPLSSSLSADKKPFTFGGFSESTKVDNAPSFTFGSSAITPTTTTTTSVKEQPLETKKPFSFGSTTAAEPKANPPSTFGSGNVEINLIGAEVNKANTTSSFTFGTTSGDSKLPNAFGSSTTASDSKPFTFGSSSSTTQTPKPFTFGSSSSSTEAPKPFTFDSSTSTSESKPFTFGSSTTSNTEAPKPFTFGSSTSESKPFTFGSSTTSNIEAPKPFTFGSSTTSNTQTPKPFTFGSSNSNTEAPKPFTFGSSTTTNIETPKPFTFGSTAPASASDVKPFTFGSSSDNPFGHAIPSSPINSSSNTTQQPPGSSSPLPDGPLSKKFHPSPSPLTFSFGSTSTGGIGVGANFQQGQQSQIPSQTPQQQDPTRKFSVPLTRRRR